MKKLLRTSALLLIVLFGSISVFAQNPNWTPVPNLQNTMTLTARLYLNLPPTVYSINGNDVVGAFVGNECRGVASPTPGANEGRIYMNIGSNVASGETVTFRAYLAGTNVVVNLNETIGFVSNTTVGSYATPYQLTITPDPLNIGASATGSGTITPSGAVSVDYGDNQVFTFTPAVGHSLSALEVDDVPIDLDTDVNYDDGTNTYTFTNVTVNHTIEATFTINTYTLTYTAGANGTLSGTSPQTVNHGSNGTVVTAVPNTGYHFTSWTGGSTENPRGDTNVIANITVTASFAINTYDLTFTAGDNGFITLNIIDDPVPLIDQEETIEQLNVSHGANATAVKAVPDDELLYQFGFWSDGNTSNPRTVVAASDITLTAFFIPVGFTPVPNLGHSMTILGVMIFNDGISSNPNDLVGAFVDLDPDPLVEDWECRGVASPMPNNSNLVFLTAGSNSPNGDVITLRMWNSETGVVCPVAPTLNFQSNTQLGTIANPYQIHCEANLDVSLSAGGFTWFSVNLNIGSAAVNSIFDDPYIETGDLADNDRIIGQNNFALWTGTTWAGSLANIDFKKSYRMRLTNANTLELTGAPIEVEPINLGPGFTWLGFLPQECIAVNTALSFDNAPATNDRIIGQSSFSVYTGTSWIGSLSQLCPGGGYVINLASANVLNYPVSNMQLSNNGNQGTKEYNPAGLNVLQNPLYTMNVLAKLQLNENEISLNQNDVVYAYINGEVRGMATPIAEHNGLIFLSIGSNEAAGEEVSFKVWIDAMQQLYTVDAKVNFTDLAMVGDIEYPFPIVMGTTGINDHSFTIGQPYPNPFNDQTMIPFSLNKAGQINVKVYNSMGQLVKNMTESRNSAGSHSIAIERENLQAGMYFYVIRVDNNQQTGTLIIN